MHPCREDTFFDIRNCRIPLLCQCSGEIPCDHHVDIVFIGCGIGDKFEIFRTKIFVQVKTALTFPYHTGWCSMSGMNPFFDVFEKNFFIFGKNIWAQADRKLPSYQYRAESVRFLSNNSQSL